MSRHAALALALLLVTSCDGRPRVTGPHLEEAPEGFAFDPNCRSARTFFLGRAPQSQRCYAENFSDAPDWITISTFEGATDEAAAGAARDQHEKQYAHAGTTEYTALLPLEIAGRPAWGFFETDFDHGKESSRTLYAVVSLDGTTYALDYVVHARHPLDEAQMRKVVKSFVAR